MKKVRITAIRKACYKDLIQQYENPLDNACTIEDGQVFIAEKYVQKNTYGVRDSYEFKEGIRELNDWL